ncbi:MAG: ribose-phosphate diphosphokinase [Methanoregulaceae archaeon]|jgi:ribose-phosphate pyrophosphokinase
MKVIGTETSQILASRISDALKINFVEVKFSRFPDGELYLCANDLDQEMIIVGSIVNSDSLIQLLLLIDACGGSCNHLVVPYMGYARQDKRFKPGEPISARAIARAISRGIDSCITVNIHDKNVLSYFDIPANDVSLATDIGNHIVTMGLKKPLILAPDDGATTFALQVATVGKWDCDHLSKTRISGDKVKIAPKSLSAKNRSIVIVDDIISTGGTIATASAMLKKQGARDVYAICIHGVFTNGAYGLLKAAGIKEIICSDTIERGCSLYSAASRIADTLTQ